jgi:hypothetical protein
MNLGCKADISQFFLGILARFLNHSEHDISNVSAMFGQSIIYVTAKASYNSQDALIINILGVLHLHAASSSW